MFTLDADHILHGLTEHFRDELEQCGHDAVEVPFYTTLNKELPLEQTASTDWHKRVRRPHHPPPPAWSGRSQGSGSSGTTGTSAALKATRGCG